MLKVPWFLVFHFLFQNTIFVAQWIFSNAVFLPLHGQGDFLFKQPTKCPQYSTWFPASISTALRILEVAQVYVFSQAMVST